MSRFAVSPARQRVIALAVTAVTLAGLLAVSPASAAQYPTWDDVERAKQNERTAAAEMTRIEEFIATLATDVARKEAEAERLGAEYSRAQGELDEAADRVASLQQQADTARATADGASALAGNLIAQRYRVGADDTALELFFSKPGGEDLLSRLSTMDRLYTVSKAAYADASGTRDNAQHLTGQANIARTEKERLHQVAEQKMAAARTAAADARAARDRQVEQSIILGAQLAALSNTTTVTVDSYREGVEKRRAEKKAAERAARDAAIAASAKPAGQAQAPAPTQAHGWVRPATGGLSGVFGPRATICAGGYCTASGHRGIDFDAGCGSEIHAAAPGRVVFAGFSGEWGNYIKVDHGGGIVTGYAHIAPGGYNVGYGDQVNAGQIIAHVGSTGASTGCHLHFEVYQGGTRLDPVPFLGTRGIALWPPG